MYWKTAPSLTVKQQQQSNSRIIEKLSYLCDFKIKYWNILFPGEEISQASHRPTFYLIISLQTTREIK